MALIKMISRIHNKMGMFTPVLKRKIWNNYSKEICVQTKRFLTTETRSKFVNAPILSGSGSVYQTSLGSDYLEIKTYNHQLMKFHLIWLRDHCRCSSCFNAQSKQRLIDPATINPDIAVEDFDISDDELTITWDDGHITSFQVNWLSKVYNVSQNGEEDKHRILWDREKLETYLPSDVTFEEYMESEEGLMRLLTNLHTFGIAFLSGIPKSRAMTRAIGERIAPLKSSVFGEIDFGPDNTEQRSDHSFGTGYLPYHTDYASHKDPPGYSFMHYLQQAEIGGETFFCDALRAARILKEHHPDDFNALATLPVAFHKIDRSVSVRCETTIFEVRGPGQDPVIIRASNDDRSVLTLSHTDANRWYTAWRKFRQITDDPKNILYVKGMPGRGIFFDNWRLMHGRLAFKGARLLETCNLSRDRVCSKLSTCAKIGSDELI